MVKNLIIVFLSLTLIVLFAEDPVKEYIEKKHDYKIEDIKIYKDTPAWDLAKFVEAQEIEKIEEEIKKHPDLLNYQEPKYGATLLLWSVWKEKYESTKKLLDCGANPDIAMTIDGATPLYLASGSLGIDYSVERDFKYLKLLLEHGADPNIVYRGRKRGNDAFAGISPLMNTIGGDIEKTKALVEAGADLNYKDMDGRTAVGLALVKEKPEYAHYLIVENHADIRTKTDYSSRTSENDMSAIFPYIDLLRYWEFEEGSEEYQMKLELIEEFARQGVEY